MNDPTRPAGRQSAADGPMQAARLSASLADALRDQAGGYADRRKTEAAGFFSELARALRSGGGELHGQTQAKSFVHTVADNLDALSGRVAGRGWRELYRDAETLSRSNPVATALVVGALGYGAFHVMRAGNVEARKPPGEPRQAWGGYP
ncbi:hypothetical protein [Methylobacterium pseudosasicola]|uniref:Uncharacterized protein n=1 Tax=Methylobacterium pseudosasicola TaxID=582667 RepID=A0A1I4SLC5_9HYPH|nr:hypothetical protein [Methylobacterium pseudosasicola]SFM65224.1 hypothetical protein SAMN05192568_104320 [Methylobacterium pseudosasicola]